MAFLTLPILISSSDDVTIGIDNYSFEVKKNQEFFGIQNIPCDSVHLIHFQEHNKKESIRYGYWFNCNVGVNGDVGYYLKYNGEKEIFDVFKETNLNVYYENINKYRNLMVNYPQVEDIESSDNWTLQTKYISWDQVVSVHESGDNDQQSFVYVDTSMTSREEIFFLQKKLNIDENNAMNEKHFKYTILNFKSKDALRAEYRMTDFLDKSNYLNAKLLPNFFNNDIKRLLGELQISFLNCITFGNYGSSLQWHNIIELLTQSSVVPGEENTVKDLDEILSKQLRMMPNEYYDILLNMKLWRKTIDKSIQKHVLVKTRKQLEIISQDLKGDHDDSDDAVYNHTTAYTDELDSGEYYYPSIGSDEESDNEGPTVVAGIYHNRNN
ncbi:hypothetical protein TPHA_0E00840 [Tetrapisispora phaffii CBS 4417]|uniref:AAR2 C-terminal domain-containing protein n=1 Tax=Tetrapisispora phaffii (strain ATCC 24235 / CBS 4417 / NBRC 1672 / NRRL Y-8282 / UCD 70-5) TaxID=1071381 RepID=G8BTF1_TETPH|nr:hypothetical protein TPHA_0E00840 [Tetrapisispora phaffii CBS 4417]CCE63179.1 hypothetical protein TPHA_0E00840 [Tetrapisispora phaffii CBS 4417]